MNTKHPTPKPNVINKFLTVMFRLTLDQEICVLVIDAGVLYRIFELGAFAWVSEVHQ